MFDRPLPSILVITGICLGSAFALLAQPPGGDPPAAERDARAVAVAERTMEAMGGREAFENARLLRFDFQVTRGEEVFPPHSHWWDRHTGEYRLEGTTREGEPYRVLFDLDTREGEAWIGSRALEGAEKAEMLERAYGRFVNDTYWLLMPWKWLDPGVRLSYEGERTIDGTTWDVVELAFGSGIGLTSNDRYFGYVNRDSGLMERWEYVLQQEDGAPGEGPPRAWAWEGWEPTNAGFRLSTVKRSLGDGPATAISFPVAGAWAELPDDAVRQALHPTSPLAPPDSAAGTAPVATEAEALLVVLNKSDHTAALVDPATGETLRTVPTGVGPHEAATSLDGSLVYVANYGGASPGNTLTVIDPWQGEVVRTVELGSHTRPHGISVAPDGAVWVTTEGSRSLLRLEPESLEIADVFETGQEVTHMVVLSPDGDRAWTTSIGSGTVTFVDPAAGTVRSLRTGGGAEGFAITPDGRELWVAHREDDDVAVLDAGTGEELARLATSDFPIRVEVTPDGERVLVSSAEGGVLEVFDRARREKIGEVRMEAAPIGIEIAPDGSRAWVANTGADTVTVVDLESFRVEGTLTTGQEPDGMAWVPRPATAPGAGE